MTRRAENLKVPGEQLTFHGWTERDRIVYAVVEHPDGSVDEADPKSIKFIDRPRTEP
jgi:hypothetical protein